MENMSSFELPPEVLAPKKNPLDNLKSKKKDKAVVAEAVVDTTPKLTRINRTLNCIYCNQERLLNPDQYQSYFDYWGDEEKIARNFDCKPCEVSRNENPFKFWFKYSEQSRQTLKVLKAAFENFKNSDRGANAAVGLQNSVIAILADRYFVRLDNFNGNGKFIIENGLPKGIEILTVPYVGAVKFLPYEEVEKVRFI